MISLVIFDSTFGNTKTIAETIAVELDAKAVSVSEFSEKDPDAIVMFSSLLQATHRHSNHQTSDASLNVKRY